MSAPVSRRHLPLKSPDPLKSPSFLIADLLNEQQTSPPRPDFSPSTSASAPDFPRTKRCREPEEELMSIDCEDSPDDFTLKSPKKARKARTAFTDPQLATLEKVFEKQKYLSVQDRMELAQNLGLNDTQVKTWYQNRRTKWKRHSAVGLELLGDASNVAAVQLALEKNPSWLKGFAAHGLMVDRKSALPWLPSGPIDQSLSPSIRLPWLPEMWRGFDNNANPFATELLQTRQNSLQTSLSSGAAHLHPETPTTLNAQRHPIKLHVNRFINQSLPREDTCETSSSCCSEQYSPS